MSEDYDNESTPSVFWPFLILLIALLLWAGYQDFTLNRERTVLNQQLVNAAPAVKNAETIATSYLGLMKDLFQTAGKDAAAAAIVKDAAQAGLIQIKPKDGSAGNASAPAPAPASGQ